MQIQPIYTYFYWNCYLCVFEWLTHRKFNLTSIMKRRQTYVVMSCTFTSAPQIFPMKTQA